MKQINFKMSWISMVICLLSVVQLSSCKTKNKDAEIIAAVQSKTQTDASLAGVTASVAEGVVTLTGQCNDENCKTNAEQSVKSIDGVKKVVNNITVAAVTISGDNKLNSDAATIVAKYPGVQAEVNDGVITLRGELQRSSLQQLMMDLTALQPKKIENQLVLK